jgi:hypothetical protein
MMFEYVPQKEMAMNTLLSAVALLAIVPTGSPIPFPQAKEGAGQVVRDGSFDLDTSADRALQLFTPEGERAWAPGWNPMPEYPVQARVAFQTNAVFRVDDEAERSLWTIVDASAQRRLAEYLYVVEGERMSRVRVEIEALDVNHSRVRVHYVHTAISEKGMQFLASVTPEAFARKMLDWRRMVSAAIR